MFTNAKNPRWSDIAHSSIIIDVLFENETKYSPFVASHSDITTHGPMLYNFAVSGLFGPVLDSDEERIIRGEIPPWEGYIIDSDTIRPMTADERVIAGLDGPQPGFKVVNGQIAEMAPKEKIAAGVITQEDYELQIAVENNAEFQRRLVVLQTPEITARAKLDKGFDAEIDAKLVALLEVKQQEGWPLVVVWPE